MKDLKIGHRLINWIPKNRKIIFKDNQKTLIFRHPYRQNRTNKWCFFYAFSLKGLIFEKGGQQVGSKHFCNCLSLTHENCRGQKY